MNCSNLSSEGDSQTSLRNLAVFDEDDALIEEEVRRIAAQLLEEAKRDEHGLYWLTYTRLAKGEPFLQVDETIFTGTTGILLFFVGLYQYSRDVSYLGIAEEGTRWIVQYAKRAEKNYVSFYSGHMGMVYLCCKMYELTKDDLYRQEALLLTEELFPYLQEGNGISDLTSGDAGNLLVLTYVYDLTGNSRVLFLIQTGLNRLITNALISRQGLKWGYNPNSLDSLCGLSHGASGIGYVFLELGRYFNSESLWWLAEQAFWYEAQYFRKSLQNWLDLRVYTEHLGKTETLRKQKLALLVSGGDVNAWAHGTAGIGLIRLRALEMLQKERYHQEAQAAVSKTIRDLSHRDHPGNYSLSSGLGGLSELLVSASITLANPFLLQRAKQLALGAIALRRKMGYYPSVWGADRECPSLLLGKAGIAYSFLRVLNAHQVDSILLPRLPSPKYSGLLSSPKDVFYWWQAPLAKMRQKVWGEPFKRTLFLLHQLAPANVATVFDEVDNSPNKKELGALQEKLRILIQLLPGAQKRVVQEIFRLEKCRINLLTSYQGVIYREVKRQALQEQARQLQELPDKEFLDLTFRTSGHVVIWMNKWNWALDKQAEWQKNMTQPPDSYPVMLVNEAYLVEEYALSPFSALLMKGLGRQAQVAKLIKKVSAYFQGPTEQVETTLTPKVITQLKQFGKEGLIEIVR